MDRAMTDQLNILFFYLDNVSQGDFGCTSAAEHPLFENLSVPHGDSWP